MIVVPPAPQADLVAHRQSGLAHPTHLFAHQFARGDAARGGTHETGGRWGREGFGQWFKRLTREARAAWTDKEGAPQLPEGVTLY